MQSPIRMLIGMVEYGQKIEEEVKAMKSEIKENEPKQTINDLDQKEEINIQQNRITEMEITWRVISRERDGGGRLGEKVQGIRRVIGMYKIDMGRLGIG